MSTDPFKTIVTSHLIDEFSKTVVDAIQDIEANKSEENKKHKQKQGKVVDINYYAEEFLKNNISIKKLPKEHLLDILKIVLKKEPEQFLNLPKKIRSNYDNILYLVKDNKDILKYLDEKLKHEKLFPDLIKEGAFDLDCIKEIEGNKELALKIIELDSSVFPKLSETFRNDEELMKTALKKDWELIYSCKISKGLTERISSLKWEGERIENILPEIDLTNPVWVTWAASFKRQSILKELSIYKEDEEIPFEIQEKLDKELDEFSIQVLMIRDKQEKQKQKDIDRDR